jgi:hypothetical protein
MVLTGARIVGAAVSHPQPADGRVSGCSMVAPGSARHPAHPLNTSFTPIREQQLHKKVLALAAVASLGITIPALAVETDQSLEVKVNSSKKGTKSKPQTVRSLTVRTPNDAGAANGTFGTKTAVISFDKNFKFNFKGVPTCSETTVAQNAANCPSGAKVGSGRASAVAGPTQGIKVNPSVVAWNGGGGTLYLQLVKGAGDPVDSSGVLIGKLGKASGGKFGSKLTVTIPPKNQQQFGLFITITDFLTSITKKGYVQTTGCTGGKWNFSGTFAYTDGTSKTATTTVKCPKK